MQDTRLTGFDFMRALACLLVFAHHATQRLRLSALGPGWREFYNFFNMGAFGVAIFFLLSGFLLARPFWLAYDAGAPMPSLSVYVLRRAARIMPGFYISLIVSYLLVVTVFGTPIGSDMLVRLAAGFLFIGEFHPLTLFPVEVNGPLWSIGMEAASYALLPIGLFVLFALRKYLPGWRGRLVFVGVVAAAFGAHSLIATYVPQIQDGSGFEHGEVGGAKFWMPRFNPVGFFVVFAMGSLTAGLSLLWRRDRTVLADLLVICGLFIAAASMWKVGPARAPESFGWLGLPYDFPLFHLGIALALLAFPHTRWLPRLSELPPVAYIAKISFGIYIWHVVILELMRQLYAPSFSYDGISSIPYWLTLTGIAFALTIAAGSLSWFLLEQPLLNWARNFEPGQNLAARKLHG